ncbi:MAG: NAD(P)H-hydrate epimerase [Planctomycetota bacterium]
MEKYQPGRKNLLMSRVETRAFDDWAINELGVPGVVLMENAGRSCAELIAEKLSGIEKPRVCIFCGTGNNGGDGFVIARHLLNRKFNVVVVICGNRNKIKGGAKINFDILEGLGVPIENLDVDTESDIEGRTASFAQDADMTVDAIFGTGLTGQLRDEYKRLIEAINSLGCPILSVDIPSGLDCDTGQTLGAAIRANCTVTFVALKKGFVLETAQALTGEIYVASIGVIPSYKQKG